MRAVPGGVMLIALPRNRIPGIRRVAVLRVADLEIDALDLHIRQGTRDVKLSATEHILLYTLAARAGVVLSYRQLADTLGRTDNKVYNNSLARHVSALRRKLRDDAQRPRYVETVSGIGFRFVAAPEP